MFGIISKLVGFPETQLKQFSKTHVPNIYCWAVFLRFSIMSANLLFGIVSHFPNHHDHPMTNLRDSSRRMQNPSLLLKMHNQQSWNARLITYRQSRNLSNSSTVLGSKNLSSASTFEGTLLQTVFHGWLFDEFVDWLRWSEEGAKRQSKTRT